MEKEICKIGDNKIEFTEYFPELQLTHDAIPIDELIDLLNKNKKCVCKILLDNKEGTGFLCKIKLKNSTFLKVLITCNHVINNEELNKNNFINIQFQNDEIKYKIEIDESRKFYTNKENFDTTIIEIIEEDQINEDLFLVVNYSIFASNLFNYECKKNIFLFHYQQGEKLSISFGTIINIKKNKFYHICNTKPGSSGGPIFNSINNEVLGIHLGEKDFNMNLGVFLKGPINDFIKKYFNEEKEQKEEQQKNQENRNNNTEYSQKSNKINNNDSKRKSFVQQNKKK